MLNIHKGNLIRRVSDDNLIKCKYYILHPYILLAYAGKGGILIEHYYICPGVERSTEV